MEAIKQQFERMNEEADKHIADAQYMRAQNNKMLEESRRMNKEANSALINSFMEGLIEFLEKKEREKRK